MSISVEDRASIHELYARYSYAFDMGTAEEWADCFTQDGSFEMRGEVQKGREALIRHVSSRRAASPLQVRHFVSNIVLQEGADSVTGRCYVAVVRIDQKPVSLLATAQYDNDKIVRTPEGWKFSSRRVVME